MRLMQTEIGEEYKIWIPCTAVSDRVDEFIQELLIIAGGMSSTPVTGVWVSGENVIQEEVHLLSFITRSPEVLVKIREIAKVLLEEGQEAVLMQVDGKGYLLKGEVEQANKNIKFTWRNENE
jgi:hypothetical protein